MGFTLGGGPHGDASQGSFGPGILSSVSTININSGAAQLLYLVPAGTKSLIVDEVVLRAPTASAALIDGSLGLMNACTNWGAFPVQTNLDGATKVTHLYPSATGDSPVIAAGASFGIILTTLSGIAGTMTVEIIGRLV